ncbi:MAG: hypothetical protein JST54_18450 [Deltaproteobacteria bacterium]|nr:hypothetical protein [Deltaproteobacteria bacterium]
MVEPSPQPSPPVDVGPKPGERTPGLMLVGLVNGLFAAGLFAQAASTPPESVGPIPVWFRPVIVAVGAALGTSAVGLLLLRRWGFYLMVLGYFSALIALVAMRQSFGCQAAMIFPLLAVAGRNWRALR